MHHNPLKNVLHITLPLSSVARSAKVSEAEAAELVIEAKKKALCGSTGAADSVCGQDGVYGLERDVYLSLS